MLCFVFASIVLGIASLGFRKSNPGLKVGVNAIIHKFKWFPKLVVAKPVSGSFDQIDSASVVAKNLVDSETSQFSWILGVI